MGKDIRQTPNYSIYLSSTGWNVRKIEKVYVFSKKIPFLGNFIKVQRPEKISRKFLEEIKKTYKPFQIVIEPKRKKDTALLLEYGFNVSKSPYLPTKTIQVDLRQNKDIIFKNLKKDARYSLRKTHDLKVIEEKNTQEFRKIWKRSVPWSRYVMSLNHLKSLKKAFGKDCVFLKTKEDTAGAIFLLADKACYYWQAFTSNKGRSNLHQYKIVWEGMMWAKNKGVKIFDFEGIYDERFPIKNWLGFTHFKRSFGGVEVSYPESFKKTNWGK